MATPTLVQHTYSGMDCYGVTTFTITFPNASLANNLLVCGFQVASGGSITSVKDNNGTSWTSAISQTNTANTQTAYIYYLANAPSGTTYVQITVSGLGAGTNCKMQGWFQEWYNVATTSPTDGSSAAMATPSKSAGSFTPGTSGDLILHWGMALSTTNSTGGAFNGTSITAGTSPAFTLLSADLQVGSCVQYLVQTTAAAINPTFTTSGSATWGSMAVAFKSASAGTAPGSGIRIVGIQHTLLVSANQSRTTPIVMQWPTQGNLLVASFCIGDTPITGVTDSASNSWKIYDGGLINVHSQITQIIHAPNATTSATLSSLTFTLSGTTTTDGALALYDIIGADTNPLGNFSVNNGLQTVAGNQTSVLINPINSGGLVIANLCQAQQTCSGLTGANYITDTVVNGFDCNATGGTGTNPSPLDEDGGFGHYYTTSTSQLTFTWTFQTGKGSSNVISYWSSSAAYFNGATNISKAPVVVQGPVNGVWSSGSTTAATFARNTTTGNSLLVISMPYDGATLRTVSSIAISTGSATFAAIKAQAGSANSYPETDAHGAANITGGTTPTVTVTFSGTVTSADVCIFELANCPSSLSIDASNSKAGAASASPSSASLTTTNTNDLIMAAFSPNGGITAGASGWNFLETTQSSGGIQWEGVGATQTTLVTSCTQNTSAPYGTVIFALQGAQPPSPPVTPGASGTILVTGVVPPRLPLRPNLTGITGTILSSGVTHVSFTPVRVIINATIGVTWNGIFRVPVYPTASGPIRVVGTFQTKTAQRAPINAVTNVPGVVVPRFIFLPRRTGTITTSGTVNVRFANVLRPTATGFITSSGIVHGTVKVPDLIVVTGGVVTARVNARTQITGLITSSGVVTVRQTGIARIPITGLITTSGVVQPHLMGQIVLPTAIGTSITSGIVHVSLVTGVLRPLAAGTVLSSGVIASRSLFFPGASGNILLFSAVTPRETQHFPVTGLATVTGALNIERIAYPKAVGFITLVNTVLNPRGVGTVRVMLTGFIGLLNTYLMVGLQPTRIVLNSKVIQILNTVIVPRLGAAIVPPPFVGVGIAGYYVILDAAGLFTILYMLPGINYIYAAKQVLYGPYASYQLAFPQLFYAFQNLTID